MEFRPVCQRGTWDTRKIILVLWLKIHFRFFFPSMSTNPPRSFGFTISTSHSRSMVSGSLSHSCYSYWKWLGKQLFKKQINNTSEKRGRYLLCLLNNKLVPIPHEFFEWIWHSRYYQWSMTENPKKKINNILFDKQTVNSSEIDERLRARNVCKARGE